MPEIVRGRSAATIESAFVPFPVGLRGDRPVAVRRELAGMQAMPPEAMLRRGIAVAGELRHGMGWRAAAASRQTGDPAKRSAGGV